jgi:hypothetical protein
MFPPFLARLFCICGHANLPAFACIACVPSVRCRLVHGVPLASRCTAFPACHLSLIVCHLLVGTICPPQTHFEYEEPFAVQAAKAEAARKRTGGLFVAASSKAPKVGYTGADVAVGRCRLVFFATPSAAPFERPASKERQAPCPFPSLLHTRVSWSSSPPLSYDRKHTAKVLARLRRPLGRSSCA